MLLAKVCHQLGFPQNAVVVFAISFSVYWGKFMVHCQHRLSQFCMSFNQNPRTLVVIVMFIGLEYGPWLC